MRLRCVQCDRPVVAFTTNRRGVRSPDPDHDLCQKCWKAAQDRMRRSNWRERVLRLERS